MVDWLKWLNTNSAAIQALSTVVLVAITAWYAILTYQLSSTARRQLEMMRKSLEPHVGMSLRWGLMSSAGGGARTVFTITAANQGQQAVTVRPPELVLPNQQAVFFPTFLHQERQFPARLEPGDGTSVVISGPHFLSALERAGYDGAVAVRSAIEDRGGRRYVSDPLELDVQVLTRVLIAESERG